MWWLHVERKPWVSKYEKYLHGRSIYQMSKRTFYYWISGSVSQELLFLVIHPLICPMHPKVMGNEFSRGDSIWMDTHVHRCQSFISQANDTNWHFVKQPLENSMCGWSTADMLWHGHHVFSLHYTIVEEDMKSTLNTDTLWIWYIFVLLSTNSMTCNGHEGICLYLHRVVCRLTWSAVFGSSSVVK